MIKDRIRVLKNHYSARWAVLKHNRKNIDKILLIDDKIILSNLKTGNVCFYRCIGELYQGIVDSYTNFENQPYDNLVFINNLEFKYSTIEQIQEKTFLHLDKLKTQGRLILSIDCRFLIFDRTTTTIDRLINQWVNCLLEVKLIKYINLINKNTQGFGNLLLVFEKK